MTSPLLAARRPLLGALVPLALAASGLAAQSLPDAQALIARHDSLVGGRVALESRTSMRLMGTFTLAAAGIDAPLEILKRRPDQYLFRTSLGPMGDIQQGYDGATAWAVQPGQGAMLLTGEQGAQIAEQADFFADLHDLTRFTALETVRDTTFEGKRAFEVQLTRTDGNVMREFFDVVTGLSLGSTVSVETPMGPRTATVTYADYRDFEGLRMATRIVQRNAQFEVVLTIVAVEFDRVTAEDVALPEAVKALIK
jgi:hypothetical protein